MDLILDDSTRLTRLTVRQVPSTGPKDTLVQQDLVGSLARLMALLLLCHLSPISNLTLRDDELPTLVRDSCGTFPSRLPFPISQLP